MLAPDAFEQLTIALNAAIDHPTENVPAWFGSVVVNEYKGRPKCRFDLAALAREVVIKAVKYGLDDEPLVRLTVAGGWDANDVGKARVVLAQIQARMESEAEDWAAKRRDALAPFEARMEELLLEGDDWRYEMPDDSAPRVVTQPADTAEPANKRKRRGRRKAARANAQVEALVCMAKHHEYDTGHCDNTTAIVISAVAGNDGWPKKASISRFLKKHFGGYDAYATACERPGALASKLKAAYEEYYPRGVVSLPDDA